jgi:3'(2'), 5'-bisphosphate nucleotidase
MDKRFIQEIKEIITSAGRIALDVRERGLEIKTKEDNSPVTNADIQISDYIFTKLLEIMPSIPVVCEERTLVDITDKKQFWLIDPIDGTRSFIKNNDSFTVNIAMIDDKTPTFGFVYLPSKDRLYFTDENMDFCIQENGKIVGNNKHTKDGLVAVVSSHNFNSETESYLKENEFSEIIAVPSSIKLCMIAEGAGDVYPKFGPTMEWDTAAGHALVKSAGGSVRTLLGEEMGYAKEGFLNPDFIAANKKWAESYNRYNHSL